MYLAVSPAKTNTQNPISQAMINQPIIETHLSFVFNTDVLNNTRSVYLIQVCYNKCMPKKIDHQKRKIQIAEATWKVIVDEGIEHATVRQIARFSGLSVGALRHYFSSQSELLRFSMELVSDRVIQRVKAREYSGDPLEFVTEGVGEVLPLDEERKIEMEVWLAFSAKALVDTALRELSNKVYNDMHQGLGNVVHVLQLSKLAKDGLDLDIEVNRLHAIVDGMAMHHLLNPERFTHDKMIETLKYHLQSLCK